ncbi:unnamed protein product [Caenorhabditis sp. 36 PRJEB53466]|nr:unnamed protein product [Caenorhabditis sp. 36 PRJEB53466]
MSSKLYSRSGVFVWSPRGIQTKGLIVADFAQFFDPNATSIEQKIDFLSAKNVLEQPNLQPSVSVNTNYRFNELAWTSMCSDAHPNGIIAGGTEDGSVVFFDANRLVKENRLEVLSARKDHHGHVFTVDVSRDGRWIASGGGSGQILLWDCANLKTPFSPGSPNFQDQVKLLRWNLKNESVFASISSRRVSCWDLRRNGAPVLEFAEIASCDWSSLCWNPSDASQLIVGSQSQMVSVIQKWDSRFTSTPIKEYRHHQQGVTSIDWNKSDDRLLISAGCDGQVIIWNHETAEVLGGAGSLQGDWIRSVRWNEEESDQFAIQYFQHPIQISSLTSLGAPQPGTEVLAARISDQFVPAWHRAPLIGSSVALGARLATFWKSYDAQTQKWNHNVEVETIAAGDDVGVADIAQYLHVKDDKRNLGWYLHERAYALSKNPSEQSELESKVWLVLLAFQEDASRSKILKYLGLIEENKEDEVVQQNTVTSQSAITTTTTTNTRSARSASVISEATTEGEGAEVPIVERCSAVDWSHLDASGWDLLLHTIRQDHLAVIRLLIASKQHVAAMMYAAQHESDHLAMILDDYNRVSPQPNPLSSLTLALSSRNEGKSGPRAASEAHSHQNIDEILKTFPDEKWRELLGMIVAYEANPTEIRVAAKHIAHKWMEQGKSLRACIAFIIAGDIDGLLLANSSFSPSDRLKQALILHQVSRAKNYSPGLEQHIISFANRLLTQGAAATAWNLVKGTQNGSAELQELQWTCYNVAGGRECTGDYPPFNPYDAQASVQPQQPQYQQNRQFVNNVVAPPVNNVYANPYSPSQSQAPPPPTDFQARRNSNLAPMPPSSTFYQTPSWDHKPVQPPTMPANMPPPKPSIPVTPGWNDPPPMAFKQNGPPPAHPKHNVMQVNWKPLEVAPTPGGMMANGIQGMSLQNRPPSAASNSSSFPSPSSQSAQAPPTSAVAPAPIQLSAEDKKIMEPIEGLAARIIENARIQARIEKATELRARIQTELTPRLAASRLSPDTKHHLTNMGYFISMHQIREAQACVAQVARNAGDFVEISSFLPALKSLLSLATH